MKIQTINSTNFKAQKLRLPVKTIDLTNPEMMQYGKLLKKVNIVQEYSNPNALNLYNKAQQSSDINEKMRLFSEMGDYELYDFGDGLLGKVRMNIFLATSKAVDYFKTIFSTKN